MLLPLQNSAYACDNVLFRKWITEFSLFFKQVLAFWNNCKDFTTLSSNIPYLLNRGVEAVLWMVLIDEENAFLFLVIFQFCQQFVQSIVEKLLSWLG